MPDPTQQGPPVSLLDQAAAAPGNAIASLLAPIVSGGAIMPRGNSLLSDQDVSNAIPAMLAFGSRLAAAGAPTLGPPTPIAGALTSGLDAGYNAAREQQMLPLLQAQAAREAAAQTLDLQQKQFEFDRERATWNMTKAFMTPGAFDFAPAPAGATVGGTAGASGAAGAGAPPAPAVVVPGPGAAVMPGAGGGAPGAALPATAAGATPPNNFGSATAIAQLPDVRALPDSVRVPVIQTAAQKGMSLDEAAQWARIIKTESGGQHIDPDTGQPMLSSKGAIGAGQVMPATFGDMKTKYGINGSINDLMPNLQASADYFHEGVVDGGNLHNATVRYDAGPGGLATYRATGQLPPETADYLASTGAPPPPGATATVYDPAGGRIIPMLAPAGGTQFAGPGAPTGAPGAAAAAPTGQPPTPGAPSAGNDPLVVDPMTGSVVPRSIAQAAVAALRGAEISKPGTGLAAGAGVVTDYLQKRAALPSFVPGPAGIQTNVRTGEASEAPIGATVASPLTPEERARLVPNALPTTAYVGDRYISGPNIGQLKGPPTALPAGDSPTVASPLTDAEQEAITPHKLAGVDYYANRYTSGPLAGQAKSFEPLNPRAANLPFQNMTALNDQVENSQPWKQWAAGSARYDAVMASLNQGTRAGDRAAIESLAKVFDPNVAVDGPTLKASGQYGGLPQQLQEAWGAVTGGTGLTDDVRQQIGNLATAEMKTRESQVLDQIERTRAQAAQPGSYVNPTSVVPLFRPLALTPDDLGGEAPPAGVQFRQPYQFDPASHKFVRAAPAAAAQGAQPPAAAPAQGPAPAPPATAPAGAAAAAPPAPPGAPNTGAPALTDALTSRGLAALPAADPKNPGASPIAQLGARILANPGAYSAHDRQLYIDEVTRRGHL